MLHTEITITDWHQTETARRILSQMGADGFPAYVSTTRPGIWSDAQVREYDRENRHVAALIAARAMYLEMVGEENLARVDFVSADEVIALAERRATWAAEFEAAVEAMDLEFPPYGNEVAKAAAEGDMSESAVVAAERFCGAWEAERQARIEAARLERVS